MGSGAARQEHDKPEIAHPASRMCNYTGSSQPAPTQEARMVARCQESLHLAPDTLHLALYTCTRSHGSELQKRIAAHRARAPSLLNLKGDGGSVKIAHPIKVGNELRLSRPPMLDHQYLSHT